VFRNHNIKENEATFSPNVKYSLQTSPLEMLYFAHVTANKPISIINLQCVSYEAVHFRLLCKVYL